MPQKICLQHFFGKRLVIHGNCVIYGNYVISFFLQQSFPFFMEVNPTVLCFQRNKFYAINA